MRRMYTFLIALVLVGGCGSSDSNLEDSIVGTWQTPAKVWVEFRDDGSYDVGHSRGQADLEWGGWSVDGDLLTQVTEADSNACAGVTGVYTIEMLDDGDRFVATPQEDTCEARVEDFTILTRVEDSDS